MVSRCRRPWLETKTCAIVADSFLQLTLQTKTDGPVRMLVVDYRSPGAVRVAVHRGLRKLGDLLTARTEPVTQTSGEAFRDRDA